MQKHTHTHSHKQTIKQRETQAAAETDKLDLTRTKTRDKAQKTTDKHKDDALHLPPARRPPRGPSAPGPRP